MIDKIADIPRNENGNLTESELQVVVANSWLKRGFNSFQGGDELAEWLDQHMPEIDSIFGAEDRVYIRGKSVVANQKLAKFVIEKDIGDNVEWKKCKDSDRWWLYIWWD